MKVHEVVGSSSIQGASGEALADELDHWLALLEQGKQPHSTELHWQTWAQSAEQLKAELVEKRYPRRQLLVDLSELVKHDARSGIQRVVRSILHEWLSNPPEGYRVEPVYGSVDDGYRYARRFTLDFMGWPAATLEDELIDYAPGDIFFGLDMQPQVQVANQAFYQRLRQQGVTVKFLLHDLLPIQMPEFFPPGNEEGFTQWLRSITATDGVICVSRTVADELRDWVDEHGPERERPLQIGWSHNGADIDNSSPSRGMPEDAPEVLAKLAERPSFLMVGTLEPRKGYADTLDVFDALWQQGEDINLVLVGKKGWKIEALAERIKSHPEYNRRLFWLAGISDEYLDKVYSTCSCLIAASYGEGFGLPLIEAAQVGMPIIARDIPVFREVAREHATYIPREMQATNAGPVITQWLDRYRRGEVRSSEEMPWLNSGSKDSKMGFIYFSYGMTKSASSFVYQLEEQIFKLSKYDLIKVPPEIRGNHAPVNYVEPITDEKIQEILDWLPENAVTVIKTHGAPSKLACDLVNEGKAFASATFRDPRDIAVSLADHGARSREKGIADFANFVRPIDALPEIKNQLNRLSPWLKLDRCQVLSYELIRTSPEVVVKKIMKQTEMMELSVSDVLAPFHDRTKIIHYNVGSPGRYKEFMSKEEEKRFKSELVDLFDLCHKEDDMFRGGD